MTDELSDNARKLFNSLPKEGTVGGITARKKLDLSQADFRRAKGELKLAGLIVVGGGRGGSLGRKEGAKLPEKPKKKSKAEILEGAREAKKERSKAQRALDSDKAMALAWGKRHYPDADKIKVGLYSGEWYVEVWENNQGNVKMIPQEAML